MTLSDFQRRMLEVLAERGDWVATGDLLADLDASYEDLQAWAVQLGEEGLVVARIASLGSGAWSITARGREVVHAGTE